MKNNGVKFIVLISLLCFSNQIFGQSNSDKNYSSTDKSIMNIIWNLKEVQERNKYVIKKTNGKRNLTLLIYKKPGDNKEKRYWIKVVEDNGSNIYSHYNFFVYPKNLKVTYFDTANNKEIELKIWRKQLKTANN